MPMYSQNKRAEKSTLCLPLPWKVPFNGDTEGGHIERTQGFIFSVAITLQKETQEGFVPLTPSQEALKPQEDTA